MPLFSMHGHVMHVMYPIRHPCPHRSRGRLHPAVGCREIAGQSVAGTAALQGWASELKILALGAGRG